MRPYGEGGKTLMKIKESKGYRVFRVCNAIFMVLLCLFILYPLWYMLIVSISNGTAVLAGKVTILPVDITFKAYETILRDKQFLNSYKNTIIITVLGTTINLIMTTLCAYPLSRPELLGRKVMMRIATFTMFFTGGMIPNYLLVTGLGLTNSFFAVVLPGAINVYNMILMRSFFEGIPSALIEAAHIDGANDLTVVSRIILPLSKPIMLTMLLFYAVSHWNGYLSSLLYLNDKNMYPIQLFVRSIVLSGETLSLNMESNLVGADTEFGAVMLAEQSTKYAIVIMSILPILIVYPIISKYFKGGIMIGAVKG